MTDLTGRIVAVHRGKAHGLGKAKEQSVDLVAGIGVVGDIHAGADVQHLSRTDSGELLPNLRQVLLLAAEEIAELKSHGFDIGWGSLGENVTTEGVALHTLPVGTTLNLGSDAVVCLTGVRNPCHQIETKFPGLLKKMAFKDEAGVQHVKGGVMAMVIRGGSLQAGDPFYAATPAGPHHVLKRV